MQLGFIGTGTISDAVIRAVCTADLPIKAISVSPRNAHLARKLAADFPCVKIAENNQDVVNNADIVFLALPAAVCAAELQALHFRAGQKLVSFVPTLQKAETELLLNRQVSVFRAMPLPFIAAHQTATPIFPADAVLENLFRKTGGVIILAEERAFNLYMMAGSFMGIYYAFLAGFDAWLGEKTEDKAAASAFLAGLFSALADKAKQETKIDFLKLQREYSTKGGTNELIASLFQQHGGQKALSKALDEAFRHISEA